MPTTINADVTFGGYIVTADASGTLALQASGNTALTVNPQRAIGVGQTPSFGTAGQVLTSQGSAAAPTWAAAAGGGGGGGQVPIGGAIVRQSSLTSPIFTDTDNTEWLSPDILSPVGTYTGLPGEYAPLVTDPSGTTPILEPNGTNLFANSSQLRIAYGNGQYITVPSGQSSGNINSFLKSTNGKGWYNAALPANLRWRDIAFGNNIFVLVANNQLNATAPTSGYLTYDGTSWTSRTNAGWASSYIGGIAFGAGVFTTVLYGSTQGYSSADGITWASTTLPSASNWTRVRYINNTFVAIASGTAAAAYSTNGTTWTAITTASSSAWSDITYANGIYVMTSNTAGTTYQTSTDLTTWTTRSFPFSITASNINTDGTTFYILAKKSYALTSTDSINWSYIPIVNPPQSISTLNDTAFVNNRLFGFTGIYSTESSGISPLAILESPTKYVSSSIQPMPQDAKFKGLAYGNNTYVTTGEFQGGVTGGVAYSTNGVIWNAASTSGVLNSPFGYVAYGAGLFVVLRSYGSGTQYITSPDGITWTLRTFAIAVEPGAIIFANNQFVLVTKSATVLTSPDGLTWTTRTGINKVWNRLTYGNSLYVAVESVTSTVMYSSDGITWTANSLNGITTRGYNSIAFGNGKFVALGSSTSSNMVAVSTNATSWTEYPTLPAGIWGGLAFGDGVFWAAGTTGGAVSTDGITWSASGSLSGFQIDFANQLFFGGQSTVVSIASIAPTHKKFFRTIRDTKLYYDVDTDATNYVVSSSEYLLYSNTPNTNFNIVPETIGGKWFKVAYGNGKFVACSYFFSYVAVSSDNGATWTYTSLYPAGTNTATNTTGVTIQNLRYINGYFVACFNASSRGYAYSTDGINWTYQTNGTHSFTDMAYGNGYYVAIGQPTSGGIYAAIRTNNIAGTWETVSSFTDGDVLNYIAFGNNVFSIISTGYNFVAWRSTDNGATWTKTYTLSTGSLPYGGNTYDFFGGYFCYGVGSQSFSIVYSSDGVTFNQRIINNAVGGSSNCIGGSGNAGLVVATNNSYATKSLNSTAFTGPFDYAKFTNPSSLSGPSKWYLRIK
jgi:hypothetical protein